MLLGRLYGIAYFYDYGWIWPLLKTVLFMKYAYKQSKDAEGFGPSLSILMFSGAFLPDREYVYYKPIPPTACDLGT